MKEIKINSGCLAEDLGTQLDKQDIQYTEQIIEKYEKIKFSIQMLYIHRYLTERQKDKSFQKFIDNLAKELSKVQE